jgi:hypothetical protein
VAAGDGRGHPDARGPGRGRHPLHRAGTEPGRPRPSARRQGLAGRRRRPHRHTRPTCSAAVRPEIALFFYDGPTSRAVAFEGLLRNGEHFAQRVLAIAAGFAGEPLLATIATDGETYGHHHRHGEMALAYMLHHVEQRSSRT